MINIKQVFPHTTKNNVSEFKNANNGSVDFETFIVTNDLIDTLLNSELKDIKQIKTAQILGELIKGNPFVYDGEIPVTDKLKNAHKNN